MVSDQKLSEQVAALEAENRRLSDFIGAMGGKDGKPIVLVQCVTDPYGQDAMYLNGKLERQDSNLYACDVAASAPDALLIVEHHSVADPGDEWPQEFADLKLEDY